MIEFRTATRNEIGTILDWAAAEGWNPGLDDAAAFHAADPEGFFVAAENGEPVAAISVVNHNADFAFLGLYLCRPSHRGRGIGFGLWQHAIKHAGDRTIGLDGVPDQQANYAKSGFVHAGATTRYSGTIGASADRAVTEAKPDDIPALIALEAMSSGWMKPAYMSAWFTNSTNRRTFVLGGGDGAQGLMTVRRCRLGAKVGPLIARDQATALSLIRHAASVFGENIIIDVPGSSSALDRLCQDLGLAPGFETARMYRGQASLPQADWYAVGTLELG